MIFINDLFPRFASEKHESGFSFQTLMSVKAVPIVLSKWEYVSF